MGWLGLGALCRLPSGQAVASPAEEPRRGPTPLPWAGTTPSSHLCPCLAVLPRAAAPGEGCCLPGARLSERASIHPRAGSSQKEPCAFKPATSPASPGTSECLRGHGGGRGAGAGETYLNDFTILSALPPGWAPGDSFLLRKMPSLFFMSLALGAEAEKGVGQPGTLSPGKCRAGRACAGVRGTYSFIVCRLWRFPLRVRYMPRSISAGPPTLGPGLVRGERPPGSCPQACVPGARQRRCRGLPPAERSLVRRDLGRRTGLPGAGRAGTQTGGARKWEGPGRGAEKKISLPANPEREPVKGASVCKGRPLGPARPAESQTQLFVTGLPVAMAAPGEGGENKSANCWEGGTGGSAHRGGWTGYF